ncbi:MAG: MFS transporter [Candidatus Omnitrophota bacterium]|nr:MFS transporter [Candidatus Omnitrophota bacterium]
MSQLTFILLCLEGAILSFNVASSAALVPSIAKDFAVSQFLAGKIIWLYMLPYGIAALIYGPLIRAFNARKIELISFLCFSLTNLLAGVSTNISMLFLARFLMGVFGASVIPLGLILIAKHTPIQNRGKFVGIFFSANFFASFLGLFLSGILPWRFIYLLPAGLGFILWVFIFLFLPHFKQTEKTFKLNYFSIFKNKTVLGIFTYIFFISLFYHGIQQWLGVYFSLQYNFNQFLISSLLTLTSLSGIFGEVIGGWLADSLGRLKVLSLGTILMSLSIFLLVIKLPILILGLIMLTWGLGWTFNHAGLSTMLTDLPDEFLNEAASLNSSLRFVSGSMGAVLGGFLMRQNIHLGFMVFGACFLCLLILNKKVCPQKRVL